MARAVSNNTTVAPAAAQDSYAALAVALPPAWGDAALSLSYQAEQLRVDLERTLGKKAKGRELRDNVELAVARLIDLLDSLDSDPDLEPTAGGSCDDECEISEDAEPSLGSLDRAVDQSRWAKGSCDDAEHDDCDREDDDPAELSEVRDWRS